MFLLQVVDHWIEEHEMLKHRLLGLQWLFGPHGGKNQAEIVWFIVGDFQIQNTVVFFRLNNASNNFTAIRSIRNRVNIVKTHSIKMPDRNSITLESDSRFVHWYKHVLNFIVKVFLYGTKALLLGTKVRKWQLKKKIKRLSVG